MAKFMFLTVGQVARLLGCSSNWVSSLVRNGQLEAYRLSPKGWYRIRVDDLLRYATRNNIDLDFSLIEGADAEEGKDC